MYNCKLKRTSFGGITDRWRTAKNPSAHAQSASYHLVSKYSEICSQRATIWPLLVLRQEGFSVSGLAGLTGTACRTVLDLAIHGSSS